MNRILVILKSYEIDVFLFLDSQKLIVWVYLESINEEMRVAKMILLIFVLKQTDYSSKVDATNFHFIGNSAKIIFR